MNKENYFTIRTIIICVTLIVCVCIVSYSYYQSNRYYVFNGFVIDKYTSIYIDPFNRNLNSQPQ